MRPKNASPAKLIRSASGKLQSSAMPTDSMSFSTFPVVPVKTFERPYCAESHILPTLFEFNQFV
ncbi:MAG TPA: hypothetical protein PKE69_25895 [Pyrinomonadaceae bacterium]|nr:hypothetical protein [Pyrinomonadaceae bacterium]